MSDVALFAIKLLGSFLLFLLGAIQILLEHRTAGGGGANRVTRLGRWLVVVAGAGFFITTFADGVAQRKEAREKAAADSLFRERTDGITQRQQRALAEILSVRNESDSLRDLQLQALGRMSSVASAGERLSNLQRDALRQMGLQLEASRHISDSLRAGVALSRNIADSVSRAESRAAERTRQTLQMVERSRNPLSAVRAAVHLTIPRNTPQQRAVVDRLYSHGRSMGRLARVRTDGRWAVVEDRRPAPILFPAGLTLDIWRGDANCWSGGETLLSATRFLDYNAAYVVFASDGMSAQWPEDEFKIQFAKNLSVDDVADACVTVGFFGAPMYSKESVIDLWSSATFAVSEFALPQGRRASVARYEAAFDTSAGSEIIVWTGRLKLDN